MTANEVTKVKILNKLIKLNYTRIQVTYDIFYLIQNFEFKKVLTEFSLYALNKNVNMIKIDLQNGNF